MNHLIFFSARMIHIICTEDDVCNYYNSMIVSKHRHHAFEFETKHACSLTSVEIYILSMLAFLSVLLLMLFPSSSTSILFYSKKGAVLDLVVAMTTTMRSDAGTPLVMRICPR